MQVSGLIPYTAMSNVNIGMSFSGIKLQPLKNTQDNFFSASNEALKYKNQGNDFITQNKYREAIECYKKAIELQPNYEDAYYNLSRAYFHIKDYQNAKLSNEKLVSISPRNMEYRVNLAASLYKLNEISAAKAQLELGSKIDKTYDPANRLAKEIEMHELEKKAPHLAEARRKQQAMDNIKNSLALAKKYFTQEHLADIADVKVMFDKTEELSGYSNIAQYENYNNRIVISNDYLWAAPEIIAAYIVHEIIHAKDKDPYTSVREEQDAYEHTVKFWNTYKNDIKDAELDYALELYNKSPQTLETRVAQIYKSRDNAIPDVSPNHGLKPSGFEYLFYKFKDFMYETYFAPSTSRRLRVVA
ncbi:MAG: tetratricopeptide repeat protein [Candidatus Gastranaerophilales bacterium]|nr:tetratricopeptide repeat protein [Candidatus Gastranaerophilales bacterium]